MTSKQAISADDRPALGAFFLFVGIVAVATMDAVGKIAANEISELEFSSVMQVTWGRFVFHFLLMTPFAVIIWRNRTGSFLPPRKIDLRATGLHAVRGVLLALSSISFFGAIKLNPVPDSIAVFFIEPLIVMLMARYFLGEAFSGRLMIAAICGLLGVLIILRPGFATDYDPTILLALAAATFFAGYIVLARFASFHTPAVITSWLTAFFGLLPILVIANFFWETPDTRVWGLMITVGFLSGIGHTMIILACRYVSASNVAIMHYAEVPVAVIISWVLFRHIPDVWVWIGVVIIAAANIYALQGKKST